MSYFDALGAVFASIWHALPEITGFTALVLAVFGGAAFCFVVAGRITGERFPPGVWVFLVLAGPVNALLVVAPLIRMGVL